MKLLSRSILSTLILCAAACTSEEDKPGSGGARSGVATLQPSGGDTCEYAAVEALTPKPVTEADLASQFATLWCQTVDVCCTEFSFATDDMKCQADAEKWLTAAPGQTYDPKLGAQCLTALQQRAAVTACAGHVPTPCRTLYRGTVAPGQPCTGDADCAVDERGITSCSLTEEICLVEVRAKAGQACNVEGAGSGGGSYSDDEALTGVPNYLEATCWREDGLTCQYGTGCVPLIALVGDCFLDEECVMAGRCVDRKCVARLANGEVCDHDTECLPGSRCPDAGSPRVCIEKLHLGDACSANDQCCGGCFAGNVCQTDVAAFGSGTFQTSLCGPKSP